MEYLESFIRYWWVKLVALIPLCFIQFINDTDEILHGVAYIIILDTMLGVWVGIKFQRFSSHRLSRLAGKVARYAIALASVGVLSAIEPSLFGWAFKWMGLFIILTEIMSNFEKLSLLGMKLPTRFLARLNKDFEKLYSADNINKKEMAERIIDNRDCRKGG